MNKIRARKIQFSRLNVYFLCMSENGSPGVNGFVDEAASESTSTFNAGHFMHKIMQEWHIFLAQLRRQELNSFNPLRKARKIRSASK